MSAIDGFTGMTGIPMWMFEERPGCWKELKPWERYSFETALQLGHDTVTYTYPVWSKAIYGETVHIGYTVDLINRTQTNDVTGFKRRLLRIVQ